MASRGVPKGGRVVGTEGEAMHHINSPSHSWLETFHVVMAMHMHASGLKSLPRKALMVSRKTV